MKPTRIGCCAVSFVTAFAVIIGVVTAAPSANKELIHDLNLNLLYLAVPIIIAVELILVYSVHKYRNNAEDRQPTRQNRRLELTWTFATAIVLLYVGATSFYVLGNPYISPEVANDPNPSSDQLQGKIFPDDPDALVIDLVAYRFGWEFTYPEANVTTQGTLVLPADTDIYIHLTARQVIHSFYVPSLGIKQDAIPERYNTIHTKITEPGTYQLYCAEFCGSGHSRMLGNITVLPKDKYRDWLRHKQQKENKSAMLDQQIDSNATNLNEKTNQPHQLHRSSRQLQAKPAVTS
jgi:cytochrome c oxidase subunit 2